MWARLLGPRLIRWQFLGFSECAVEGPTAESLKGHAVVSLYFSANWCQMCSELTPVLERLYTAQEAQGADQLEIVLVSRCREAKATKYYSLGMSWLSMWHNVDDKVRMKACTMALMAKFGISTIPALVLLDERGRVICLEACGWVNADPKGKAFPWRETAGAPMTGPAARAVVNYDLPPAAQPFQERSGTVQPTLSVSPERILPASQAPSEFLARKQKPVSMGCPIPTARAMAAPNADTPPLFPSHHAKEVQAAARGTGRRARQDAKSDGPMGA